MNKHFLTIMAAGVIILSVTGNAFAEETVGCPHHVGKGKVKIRSKVAFVQAQECYSDEVWKALHDNSPYSIDDDKMVDLPEEWHQSVTQIALGVEYGIVDKLSLGVFFPYVIKDLRRQVWSPAAKKTVWKEIEDDGLADIWLSAKYLVYSESPGLLGLDWEDGLLLALGYKPSISSDEKVKSGIASGGQDFKLVLLSHPHFTEALFLCSDAWYQFRGEVKDIDGFAKSGWDLGDKFGYRAFMGCEFWNHRFAVIGGPQGWLAGGNQERDGSEIEDSSTYSHSMVAKFRWQPYCDEDAGSIDIGVRMPYANKTAFAPVVVPTIGCRIKF